MIGEMSNSGSASANSFVTGERVALLRSEVNALRRQVQTKEKELLCLGEQLVQSCSDNVKCKRALSCLQESLKSALQERDNLRFIVASKQRDGEKLKSQIKALQNSAKQHEADQKKKSEQESDRFRQLEEQAQQLAKKVDTAERIGNRYKCVAQRFEVKASKQSADLREKEEQLDEVLQKLEDCEKAAKRTETARVALLQDKVKAEKQVQKLKQDLATLRNKSTEHVPFFCRLQDTVLQEQAENAKLREILSKLQNQLVGQNQEKAVSCSFSIVNEFHRLQKELVEANTMIAQCKEHLHVEQCLKQSLAKELNAARNSVQNEVAAHETTKAKLQRLCQCSHKTRQCSSREEEMSSVHTVSNNSTPDRSGEVLHNLNSCLHQQWRDNGAQALRVAAEYAKNEEHRKIIVSLRAYIVQIENKLALSLRDNARFRDLLDDIELSCKPGDLRIRGRFNVASLAQRVKGLRLTCVGLADSNERLVKRCSAMEQQVESLRDLVDLRDAQIEGMQRELKKFREQNEQLNSGPVATLPSCSIS